MKPKHKYRLQLFLSITFLLSLLFVICRVGALELDSITVRQAVVSSFIAIGYMAVAVITYKFIGKEEMYR